MALSLICHFCEDLLQIIPIQCRAPRCVVVCVLSTYRVAASVTALADVLGLVVMQPGAEAAEYCARSRGASARSRWLRGLQRSGERRLGSTVGYTIRLESK